MSKYRLFASKRGIELSIWAFIDFVLIATLFMVLFGYTNSLRDNTYLERQYLSKDIALMTDAMQTIPGNGFMTYDGHKIDLARFYTEFSDNQVLIRESESIFSRYPMYDSRNTMKTYEESLNKSAFYYSKIDNELFISDSILDMSKVNNGDCGKFSIIDTISENAIMYITYTNDNSVDMAKAIDGYVSNSALNSMEKLGDSSVEDSVLIVVDVHNEKKDSSKVNIMFLDEENSVRGFLCYVTKSIGEIKSNSFSMTSPTSVSSEYIKSLPDSQKIGSYKNVIFFEIVIGENLYEGEYKEFISSFSSSINSGITRYYNGIKKTT